MLQWPYSRTSSDVIVVFTYAFIYVSHHYSFWNRATIAFWSANPYGSTTLRIV